jgi:hypothetical protein
LLLNEEWAQIIRAFLIKIFIIYPKKKPIRAINIIDLKRNGVS